MSGDERTQAGEALDLDAMREKLGDFATPMSEAQQIGDALVAEVRRLREERAAIDLLDWPGEAHRLQAALYFAKGTIDDLSTTVDRLEAERE